ncbi:unnamed protein product [Camellia sinensis]
MDYLHSHNNNVFISSFFTLQLNFSSFIIFLLGVSILSELSYHSNCELANQMKLRFLTILLPNTNTNCAKHDPEVSEDIEKNFAKLLSEELKLRETEALESQQRADMALLEATKITFQYQKEADKCNSGMETCEEAREKAEAVLLAQKRLTAMWESRTR